MMHLSDISVFTSIKFKGLKNILIVFLILISPISANANWWDWTSKTHKQWMNRTWTVGWVLGIDSKCSKEHEYQVKKIVSDYINFLELYSEKNSIYVAQFIKGYNDGRKLPKSNKCGFYKAKRGWEKIYNEMELSGYGMPDFNDYSLKNSADKTPETTNTEYKKYVENHAKNIDKAIVSLNETTIIPDTVFFDKWNPGWKEQFKNHYFVYFPMVFDSIHGSDFPSTTSICFITSKKQNDIVNNHYGVFGERALKSAALLYVSRLWENSEAGQVRGDDNSRILNELNKYWAKDDVEKVIIVRSDYNQQNLEKLAKEGLWSQGKWAWGGVVCSGGILTDIVTAEVIVKEYFDNPAVAKRNSSNDDWMRAMEIIPKKQLQDVAASFRGFSSHADMKENLGIKPK